MKTYGCNSVASALFLFCLFVYGFHDGLAVNLQQYQKVMKKGKASVRLVGGGNHDGNVEVFHEGRWGAVCDDEWDIEDANVVCRQLGYKNAYRSTHSSTFGPAKRKFWLDNVMCTGTESSLAECRAEGWGQSDCTPSEAAGVQCLEPEDLAPTSQPLAPPKKYIKDTISARMSIRLTGGRNRGEGRVEVRIGKSPWGLVCGDGWSLLEANVVCRQLNLGYATYAVQTDYFGPQLPSDSLALTGVECRGFESALGQCRHAEGLTCPGDGKSVAGVFCTSQMADLVIDHHEIMRSSHLEDRQLFFLQCAMEENCLASSAYTLQSDRTSDWHLESRRLLRFTARILNLGTADFHSNVPKHLWEFHQCHMHYHSMEIFARFDVLDSSGNRIAEGHKASFCLEDNQCLPGIEPRYACANFGDQGISVNCTDIYRYNIDCQWVDITDVEPGEYTFKVSINPEFKVAEQSFENNAAVCKMVYTASFVSIHSCYLTRP